MAGDGRFFYLPKVCCDGANFSVDEPPVDSIRLEMTRDGIEGWEYFALLRARITDAHLSGEEAPNSMRDTPSPWGEHLT
jgi:hypothetical protein